MPSGKIEKVTLSDYKGKWVVLLFYPLDFTFVSAAMVPLPSCNLDYLTH
jgi:alkyl hydroperoxide reductase subunit AhpC